MQKEKRSFFERLTGAIRLPENEEDTFETNTRPGGSTKQGAGDEDAETEQVDGQLMVDVYQTHNDIVIKTMVPGVRPEDLDITIARDIVTIKCKRETERNIADNDYFHRELYWGGFSRTIMLPQEIDIDSAEAVERHGLLIIKLPKLDKNRQTKVRVKNNDRA